MNTLLVHGLKALAVVAILWAGSGARLANAGETSVYVKSGWFAWDEKLNGGSVIKESGAVHGAGITRKDFLLAMSLAETLELWGGNVQYDGRDVTNSSKLDTDTSYLGTREEVSLGVKLRGTESLSCEPFAGIGHRFWVRTHSSEDWNSFYAKAGMAGELKAAGYSWHLKGGALLPLHTRNHVSLAGSGFTDVTTEPKSRLSGFAEAGVRRGAFAIGLEYEGFRFGQSDKVPTSKLASAPGAVIQNNQAFQPDSQSDLVSLKFAYSF